MFVSAVASQLAIPLLHPCMVQDAFYIDGCQVDIDYSWPRSEERRTGRFDSWRCFKVCLIINLA